FRLNVDEREATIAKRIGELVNAVLDLVRVVAAASFSGEQGLQGIRLHVLQAVDEIYLAEFVASALLDRESDVEPVARGRELGDGRDDAEVRKTLREVEFSQEFTIIGQAVGIVDVVAAEEPIPARLPRANHSLEPTDRELVRADEVDGLDTGRGALIDLEHQIDPVLCELDHLGINRRGEAAVAPIEIKDALHIPLHLGSGEDRARLELYLRG